MKQFLALRGVEFVEKNVSTDLEGRAELQALGFDSTPVTVVGDSVLEGFDVAELDAALTAAEAERREAQARAAAAEAERAVALRDATAAEARAREDSFEDLGDKAAFHTGHGFTLAQIREVRVGDFLVRHSVGARNVLGADHAGHC